MSKKVSRSKRRELKDKGLYEAPPRLPESVRAQRRAEEEAAGVHVAPERDELREDDAPVLDKKQPRRDRTVLVLVGLTALAGLIFWLTQRSPNKETKITVPATGAAASADKR